MLYERFPNEAAFSNQFILPLLNRLGFREVALTHGQREFGKDFVFAETTRFGFTRYNAAQVKHLENITQDQHAVLEDLLRQIREAFTVPARLVDPHREQHISSVYIFNSGGITENAREYLLRNLPLERFGANVHIFDSPRLESANQFVAYSADRDLRPRLVGLRNHLALNYQIWQNILNSLPDFSEARGSLLSALEAYMATPLPTELVDLDEVALLLQEARIVDSICLRYILGVRTSPDVRDTDTATIRGLLTDRMLPRTVRIAARIEHALDALNPLAL